MTRIDDAVILKLAKELCEQDGVAWNSLTVTVKGMRVLTAADRRECLMRAREALMSQAAEAGVVEEQKPVDAKPVVLETSASMEDDEASGLANAAAEEPQRRVA